MPKVSVIVPVYNVERYLARCLDSVLGQTERDFEIVCVDDGSTDSSPRILAEYAARDPRVRVVTQANRGLSGARNAGLDAAAGEWIMFVDSDDWVPAYAVEGFLRVARESGAPVVVSERYAVDTLGGAADSPRSFRWTAERPALARLVGRRKMQSSAWNKFYRADLLRSRRFIEGIYFEDWPFVTELFGDIDFFALVREPMYVYCKNGDAASIVRSPFDERKAASYMRGIEHVTEHFRGHPMEKWAAKRVAIARKMLLKRMRRAGMPVPASLRRPSLGKRLENALHAARAAVGAWKCRRLWREVEPKKVVFSQFQGGGFGCNQKYVALELLRRRRDLDLVWLLRNPGEGGFPEGIRTVAWNGPDAMRELATAKVWCSNHNLGHFVKNRGLVKKPGQFYCQTWHGSLGIKRCLETLGPKEAAMLDVFLSDCRWESDLVRGWFGPGPRILLSGHPRNDVVVASRSRPGPAAPGGAKTLLYVPTFRDDGALDGYLTDFAPLLAALAKRWPGEWRVQARLHPNMRKKGVKLDFSGDVEDVTSHPDIQELLAGADVVVSDYSSCIFDFAFSGRPAFVYAPDRAKYETERGFYYPLSATPFPVAEDLPSLCSAVEGFDEGGYARRLAEFLKGKGAFEDGRAAERAADVVLAAIDGEGAWK